MQTAYLAAHRFGLGEASLAVVGADPAAWLHAQVGPADPQPGPGGAEGLRLRAAYRRRKQAADGVAELRALMQADVRARMTSAATTARPFTERLALFWANHFTVSLAKSPVRGLAGAFEREAIRPHVAGRFATMLKSVVHHPAMLAYLDNEASAGPDSPIVRRLGRRAAATGEAPRLAGLNENLAREVLELHTLGVDGGYTQADVTAFAAVLTGWRVGRDGDAASFNADWHQPGPKTVLGRRYAEGPQALDAVLDDLAAHPSTARFVATKLARQLAADDPPHSLVARLERRFHDSGGDLGELAHALVDAPEPWAAGPLKLKTPQEFVIGSLRLLGAADALLSRWADGGSAGLGQPVQAAPSPAGWPDRAEEWLGPDALWKRVEWTARVCDRAGRTLDARRLAEAAFGAALSDASRRQIERAADGPQALALLLLSPEHQHR